MTAPDNQNHAPGGGQPQVSVLIPAHNEAGYITACLASVFASDPLPDGGRCEVLVLANGCTDNTAALARDVPVPAGWECRVIDLPEGGKLGALNAGDAAARGGVLIYLDADVTVSPELIGQITQSLSVAGPRYASGTPDVSPAQSAVTRAYRRIWTRLPFVTGGVPGFGVFAMNRAGRARWDRWPAIISDDTFARLNFAPAERIRCPGRYSWPMVEGFRNLVRVRRRQNDGVDEITAQFPQLLANEDKQPLGAKGALKLLLSDPAGMLTYCGVSLVVKTPLFASQAAWTRGR